MTDILLIGRRGKAQHRSQNLTWLDSDAYSVISGPDGRHITDFDIVIFWPTGDPLPHPEGKGANRYQKEKREWQVSPDTPSARPAESETRSGMVTERIYAKPVHAKIRSVPDPKRMRGDWAEQFECILDATSRGLCLIVVVPEESDTSAFPWLRLAWRSSEPRPRKIFTDSLKDASHRLVPFLMRVSETATRDTWWCEFLLPDSAESGFSPVHIDYGEKIRSVMRLSDIGGIAVLPALRSPDALLTCIGAFRHVRDAKSGRKKTVALKFTSRRQQISHHDDGYVVRIGAREVMFPPADFLILLAFAVAAHNGEQGINPKSPAIGRRSIRKSPRTKLAIFPPQKNAARPAQRLWDRLAPGGDPAARAQAKVALPIGSKQGEDGVRRYSLELGRKQIAWADLDQSKDPRIRFLLSLRKD